MKFNIKETSYGLLVPPQLKDDGAPAGLTYLDSAGYAHLRALIIIGTTDVAMTASVKLQHCDTSGGSYTDIASAALADAIGATEDDSMFAIDVDLTGSGIKRYIKALATCGDGTTGTNICVVGILSNAEHHAGNAADAGLTELIEV